MLTFNSNWRLMCDQYKQSCGFSAVCSSEVNYFFNTLAIYKLFKFITVQP